MTIAPRQLNQYTIQDEDQLIAALSQYKIDTSTWGKPVSNLYKEIKEGECALDLEKDGLNRRVSVVTVKCFHTNAAGERFQLIEREQVFKDGRVRNRNLQHLAEKAFPNESIGATALRALKEELGITGLMVRLGDNKVEVNESSSYKGVKSTYELNSFSCEIPLEKYKEEYVEKQKDKDTYFSWMKI